MAVDSNYDAPDQFDAPVKSGPSNIVSFIKGSAEPSTITPAAADTPGLNMIDPWMRNIKVAANTNDVNDWITLPALASVPDGHTITIVGNTAGFEIRTPATSAEEINSEDCDGTKEYAVGANNVVVIMRKINGTIGWMGQGFTAIGAVVSAVVPD